MRLVWSLSAIVIGWLLAAVVLWEAGRWVERTHRYDECTYVAHMAREPFWACPAKGKPPDREPGAEA